MREFFRELVHALESGEAAELVSVLESSGSTPPIQTLDKVFVICPRTFLVGSKLHQLLIHFQL